MVKACAEVTFRTVAKIHSVPHAQRHLLNPVKLVHAATLGALPGNVYPPNLVCLREQENQDLVVEARGTTTKNSKLRRHGFGKGSRIDAAKQNAANTLSAVWPSALTLPRIPEKYWGPANYVRASSRRVVCKISLPHPGK